jgi:dUTP pyrophosphatase
MTEHQITIGVKLLDEDMPMPRYAHEGDAGLDLRAAISTDLKPFERMLVPCGIAVEIPTGYAGFVIPRSGLSVKHGISIVNAPGLVDSGYRGELKVNLINLDAHETFHIERGDRIAQISFLPVPPATLQVKAELSDSERGVNGFGSSGVKA